MKGNDLIKGTFSLELKNRFRCLVKITDKEEICYVASSSRLSNFINLSGQNIIVKATMKNAKTRYSLYALQMNKYTVLLNLTEVNRIVAEQLHRRYFAFLGKRHEIQREIKVEGYKADLYLPETNTIIEIKTVLSLEKEAVFPTVYSERSIKQLKQLRALQKKGYKICFMFVSLSPTVKSITLIKSTEFTHSFRRCVKAGFSYCAYSLNFDGADFKIGKCIALNYS